MCGRRFSPFDFPWLSTDPDSACCMCPDAFREKCISVDYCPQHGDEPDFSQCHDRDAGRRWRVEQEDVCPTCFSGKPELFRMTGCGFKCDDPSQWHAKQRRMVSAPKPSPPIEDDPVAKRLGIVRCCDLHGVNCEPPSELCCRYCTEANHPDHPNVDCVLRQQDSTADGSNSSEAGRG